MVGTGAMDGTMRPILSDVLPFGDIIIIHGTFLAIIIIRIIIPIAGDIVIPIGIVGTHGGTTIHTLTGITTEVR